jgi:hypothetical protein
LYGVSLDYLSYYAKLLPVSVGYAEAVGYGTAAGRDSAGPIPTTSFQPSAIPDHFTHVSNPASKTPVTPVFDRFILIFAKESRKCLSMNNLRTKSKFFQSALIKPNQA